tara:strand:- start:833 stop:1024 length:192 start_codon:yes stop_codon:yes gene_type:complete
MAAESIALSGQLQAGLQALKSSIESEAAVVSLVQQAASSDGNSELSSSSEPTTDLSRLLDVVI